MPIKSKAAFGTLLVWADCLCMSSRRDDIDEELRQLKNLERLITDQKTLDDLKALIADFEEEKAELDKQ